MKRVLSIILALLMVVSTLVIVPVTASAEEAAPVWDGKSVKPEGKGTADDPYKVAEAGNWKWLQGKHSNAQALTTLGPNGKSYAAQYYTYYDWIDADGKTIVAEGTEGAKWMPIPVGTVKANTSKLQP